MSTHSPNLASKASLESLIVMKNGMAFPMNKGLTKLEDDDYVFLEKFLDVSKANLFFAKSVLIVEGDGENILLPTIAELLGRPLENYGASIINVGNTAYARYAKIFIRKDVDEMPDKWLPTKVACLLDLDLWPEKADKNKHPDIGFKEVNARNKHFWRMRTDDEGAEFGTKPEEKKERLKKFIKESVADDGSAFISQNVKVCVSDDWTFEYSLANSPLAIFVYEALNGSQDEFDTLPEDAEERAIKIYGMIEKKGGAKTEVAYTLSSILQREFGAKEKTEDLKNMLPTYILEALAHVTEPWIVSAAALEDDAPEQAGEVPATEEAPNG